MVNTKRIQKAVDSLWELIENISYVRSAEGTADKDALDTWHDWATECATLIQSGLDEDYNASTKKSKIVKADTPEEYCAELIEKIKHNADYVGECIEKEDYMAGFTFGTPFIRDCATDLETVLKHLHNEKREKSTKKSKSVKKGWPQPSEAYDRLWDRYVPDSGKADTEIGEILRCASRVIYRFYNDGDIYGTDNGESVQYELDYLARCNVPYIKEVAQEIIDFCNQYVYDVAEEGEDPDDPDYTGPIYREFGGYEAEYDALMNSLADAVEEYCWTIERSGLADKSAKKSLSLSGMRFEDNVNKMRRDNYAKTGNINTVMKKRD